MSNRLFCRAGAVGLATLVASAAWADVFYLRGDYKIEGKVLEDRPDVYRIRTGIGIVDLEKSRVVRRVIGETPWDRYEEQRKKHPATAEGRYALAQWCAANGLRTQEREHLREVLRLDADHAKARRRLGYVRKEGRWVRPSAATEASSEEREAQRRVKEHERTVAGVVAEWGVKVRDIYRGRLAGNPDPSSPRFRDGRNQLLAIRDPLAIPALASVLSTGKQHVRRVLVECLGRFDVDEATMNLIVISLLDPSADLRKAAAVELIRRKDPRIIETLCQALRSDEEHVLRHAAAALGVLRASDAVEDLIDVLSVQTPRSVLMSGPVYLDSIWYVYGGARRYWCNDHLLWYQPAGIAALGPGTMLGTASWYEVHLVSIHRTEVQEALIQITGRNFGFDANAWREWWRHHQKTGG